MTSTIRMLTRYSRRASSSRLRHLMFEDRLRADGHTLHHHAFFKDSHLERIYGEMTGGDGPAYRDYASCYASRFRTIGSIGKSDILWVEKEIFPYLPARFDLFAMSRSRKCIIDIDDAWFLRYEDTVIAGPGSRRKFDKLLAAATVVTVPNSELENAVYKRGATDVRLIRPMVDTDMIHPREVGDDSPTATIGWIGTPPNAEEFLAPLTPVLNKLTETGRAKLLLIGARDAVPALRAERVEWTEETEASHLQRFDIGIMPLADTPWNRCKSGFKLIQTMAAGAVPAGSAVGFNTNLIADGINGVLVKAAPEIASMQKEWFHALDKLIDDPKILKRLALAARKTAEERFSFERRRDDVSELFASLA
ncbi:MAG: glycosyltransferase family 4 protein [Rhizobiaceae bacterium]